jgi:hypothetical protein
VDRSTDRSRVPSQAARDALEAKTSSTREGENRSGGHGGGERGKPRRRGRATNAIPTLQMEGKSGSEDECCAATQWEGPVCLWRRAGVKVHADFTQFVSTFMVGVEGTSAYFWQYSTCKLWPTALTSYIVGSLYECRCSHFLSASV